MSGVRMLHFLKDGWKFIKIHQYYTMAFNLLISIIRCFLSKCCVMKLYFLLLKKKIYSKIKLFGGWLY